MASCVRSLSKPVARSDLKSVRRMNWLRVASKLKGARRKPIADPTPAPVGTRRREIPNFSHKRPACNGAAPPKAIIVYSLRFSPFSTAWTRAALAIFSSTTSQRPKAAVWDSISSVSPTCVASAAELASAFSVMRPPAKLLGSSRPRTKSASVTAGRVPPRP